MARIGIFDVSHLAYEYNFGGVARVLADAGHDVMAFYDSAEPPRDQRIKHGRCYWMGMALTPFFNFKPEHSFVFNGSHPHRYSATRYVSLLTKVIYAENGWLPQGDNMYLDRVGVGSRSSIFLNPCKYVKDGRDETIAELQRIFAPSPPKIALPKDYVLVPLQLESDTSIVYDSPYFKSIRAFVHFVRWHFSDMPIVVKLHPKDSTPWSFDDVHMVDGSVKMNDLVPGARLVVGINSTSLIEALVHYKPVMALGLNVASNKEAYIGEAHEFFYGYPRLALDRGPNKYAIDNVLHMLARRQFPRKEPPTSILQLLEDPG